METGIVDAAPSITRHLPLITRHAPEGNVQTHLGEVCRTHDAAKHAGLSEQHFCRTFKQFCGKTFTEYVNQVRVAEAQKRLLASER